MVEVVFGYFKGWIEVVANRIVLQLESFTKPFRYLRCHLPLKKRKELFTHVIF